MRPWSVKNIRLPRSIPTLSPPFPSPALRKGKRGISSVPQEINFPREASHSLFFFEIFFILMYYIQGIYTIYICTHLIFGFGGGPVEQPPLDPNGKALNQPKPHPSNRTV